MKRRALFVFALFIALAFCTQSAYAQGGCWWAEYWGEVSCSDCGGVGSQPNYLCTGFWTDGWFCLQGYSECCGNPFGTTSMVPDRSCGPSGTRRAPRLKPHQFVGDNYLQVASLYLPSCQGGYASLTSVLGKQPILEAKPSRQDTIVDSEIQK